MYYDSQSSADAAISHKLAFWTDRDGAQVERIMQGSGLVRDKWNSRRGGSTWLADEIARAIENTPEGYEWKKPHSRSHSLGSTGMRNEENNDLKHSIQALSFSGREKPAPRGWIVDNTIWEGHATSWFGEGGVAKSLLGLHLGLTVAEVSRSYWMAFAVKTVPVLYLDFELDADEQHRRALELAAGMKLKGIPENFYYLSVAMMPPVQAFMVAAEECRRLGIGLVIVDSVGFALGGDSESAKDVLDFYRACIQPLKDAGASPLLIDHQAKIIKGEKYSDKQAFGSVYKTNAVRSSFQIRGDHEQGEITATFTHKKNNFGWKENDFSLKVVFETGRITVERLESAVANPDREPSKKEQVLEAVEKLKRATAETVSRETDIDLKTVQNAFTELLRVGALRDTGEKQGRYRVVIPHSQPTKGTGTGTSEKDAPDYWSHPLDCDCEVCV
ncbi:MAG: AAA family ATPase [Actinomycetota bacterium]|nr:AAA family ATPase [Actinomycetota bacterium]